MLSTWLKTIITFDIITTTPNSVTLSFTMLKLIITSTVVISVLTEGKKFSTERKLPSSNSLKNEKGTAKQTSVAFF